nr:ribosomal protein S2 [Nitzschia traheaformis]
MKIRAFKSKQILSLYLLKSKTYEQTILKKAPNLVSRFCLTEILISFKKSLQIIFNYHKKNKLILFVGLPESLRSKINKSTIHVAFSKYFKLEGNISNVSKNKNLLHVPSENNEGKKPYLIVFFDHINMDSIIKESYLAKIPLICVNSNFNNKNFYYRNIYKVFINQNLLQVLNNFFFVGLSFLFKQSKI